MDKRVLVVDDIPMNCKVLVMHLAKFDIPCDMALNGEQAVAACMRRRYTIVLMDLDMPRMDGIAATKLIRKYEHAMGIRTPIVAISSFDSAETRQRCVHEGMDGLMQKGLKADELLKVIYSYHMEDTSSRSPMIVSQRLEREQLGMSADLSQLEYRFAAKTTEIVKEFLIMSKGFMGQFEEAIGDRNSIELTHVSYALKGAASNLGLDTMANLCAEISDDGFAGHWHRVSRKYRELVGMLYETSQRISRTA